MEAEGGLALSRPEGDVRTRHPAADCIDPRPADKS